MTQVHPATCQSLNGKPLPNRTHMAPLAEGLRADKFASLWLVQIFVQAINTLRKGHERAQLHTSCMNTTSLASEVLEDLTFEQSCQTGC